MVADVPYWRTFGLQCGGAVLSGGNVVSVGAVADRWKPAGGWLVHAGSDGELEENNERDQSVHESGTRCAASTWRKCFVLLSHSVRWRRMARATPAINDKCGAKYPARRAC